MREARSFQRDPAGYPVIFGGVPFVGEGTVTNLSMKGCSIVGYRTVLVGSFVKLSVILPDARHSLFIELGQVRWVRSTVFGVEFLRMSALARHQLAHIVGHQPILSFAQRLPTNPHPPEACIAIGVRLSCNKYLAKNT
ncbi:MAG: PilZ domain-containing protein [Nitrospira sp.]|nr:PilZ domain-containing protein [Nitrospira sp.]